MKKINDEQILNTVKKEEANYNIKLSSSEILSSYYVETPKTTVQNPNKEKKKTKGILATLGTVGCLALAGVIICCVIILTPQETISINQNYTSILSHELLTFTCFNVSENDSDNSSLLYKKPMFSNVFYENININEDFLEKVVQGYDEVCLGIENIFDIEGITATTYQESFTYNNKSYTYRTEYTIEGDTISILYYNDLTTFTDYDETRNYVEALYYTSNEYYETYIIQETETDKDEIEDETSIILIGENNFYRVDKEYEYEANESDESYSYSTFLSAQDALEDENPTYKLEYSIETENDKEEIELQIEDNRSNNKIEYEYKDITKLSERNYSFFTEYEKDEIEFSGSISLSINENNSRTYTYNDISITLE